MKKFLVLLLAVAMMASFTVCASAEATIADGTYQGSSISFGFTGPMICDVTFEGGKITDVKVVEECDTATGEWFYSARDLLIPRIIESQSLSVDAITGATFSSAGILGCVADAINNAGGSAADWYVALPETAGEKVVIDGYDVIVVGMGGSGILSYCAAADNGATVFGIETAGKVGGDSACTTGPMALNSKNIAEQFGLEEEYFDEDELYNIWIEYVESEEKADVIKEAVYNSGSALDYYIDNFQFDFRDRDVMRGSFVIPEWTHLWVGYTPDPETGKNGIGPNKTYQFLRALDIANAMNEKNQYMTELTADSLIFDESGKVIGVSATYYDGTTYEIYGNSVILATGGYFGSAEMMKENFGSTVNSLGVTVNKGDGIKMGISAGGATYAMKTLPMIHIQNVKNIIRTDALTGDQKAILSALAINTVMPMFTTTGEVWDGGNIVYAPDFMYYVFYTQEDIDAIARNGLTQGQAASLFFFPQGKLPEVGTPVADIYDILAVGEQYRDVVSAANVEELAKKCGIDAAKLAETLGEVSTSAVYAVPCTSYGYATVGGLDVDANMNVLREDGSVIENLFAVGQDSEGVCNIDGKPYTPWGGQAQSWTFVSGQIAGTQAALLSK